MNLLVGLWKQKKLWINGQNKFGSLKKLFYICILLFTIKQLNKWKLTNYQTEKH